MYIHTTQVTLASRDACLRNDRKTGLKKAVYPIIEMQSYDVTSFSSSDH
jgi:hypothetical protein